jgi:hypothetical protein
VPTAEAAPRDPETTLRRILERLQADPEFQRRSPEERQQALALAERYWRERLALAEPARATDDRQRSDTPAKQREGRGLLDPWLIPELAFFLAGQYLPVVGPWIGRLLGSALGRLAAGAGLEAARGGVEALVGAPTAPRSAGEVGVDVALRTLAQAPFELVPGAARIAEYAGGQRTVREAQAAARRARDEYERALRAWREEIRPQVEAHQQARRAWQESAERARAEAQAAQRAWEREVRAGKHAEERAAEAARREHARALAEWRDTVAAELADDVKQLVPSWAELPSSRQGLYEMIYRTGPRKLVDMYGSALERVREAIPPGHETPLPFQLAMRVLRRRAPEGVGAGEFMGVSTRTLIDDVIPRIEDIGLRRSVLDHVAAALNELEPQLGEVYRAARREYAMGRGIQTYVDAMRAFERGGEEFIAERLATGLAREEHMAPIRARGIETIFERARHVPQPAEVIPYLPPPKPVAPVQPPKPLPPVLPRPPIPVPARPPAPESLGVEVRPFPWHAKHALAGSLTYGTHEVLRALGLPGALALPMYPASMWLTTKVVPEQLYRLPMAATPILERVPGPAGAVAVRLTPEQIREGLYTLIEPESTRQEGR